MFKTIKAAWKEDPASTAILTVIGSAVVISTLSTAAYSTGYLINSIKR